MLDSKGDNGEAFTVSEDVYLESYGYVVFAARLNPLDNGGISQVDYAYSVNDLRLNSADTLQIEKADATLLDEVVYDADAFPFLRGASISLGTLDSSSNDEEIFWCLSEYPYGNGDFGTPGFHKCVL